MIEPYLKYSKTGRVVMRIQSLEGGLDAKNFTFLIFNMYRNFLEKHRVKFDYLEYIEKGKGLLNSVVCILENFPDVNYEYGTYKLIRKSPFDHNKRRQTSFCAVKFLAESKLTLNFKLSDCRIDTYRASGKGGQNVNKVETAVRVVHTPTNTVVTCQDNRDQASNKQAALCELQRRLLKRTIIKLDEQPLECIKSFVFDPDEYVKCLITNHKYYNVKDILEGNFDASFFKK